MYTERVFIIEPTNSKNGTLTKKYWKELIIKYIDNRKIKKTAFKENLRLDIILRVWILYIDILELSTLYYYFQKYISIHFIL